MNLKQMAGQDTKEIRLGSRGFRIAMTVCGWYLTQIFASLIMKNVMKKQSITPIVMASTNVLISASLDAFVIFCIDSKKVPAFEWRGILLTLPSAVCVVLVKVFTLFGYEYITISLAHTIKACEPFFTVLLAYIWLERTYKTTVYLSIVPILLGACMAAYTDSTYSAIGILAVVGATVSQAFNRLYIKRSMATWSSIVSTRYEQADDKQRSSLVDLIGLKCITAAVAFCLTLPLAILEISRTPTSQPFVPTLDAVVSVVVTAEGFSIPQQSRQPRMSRVGVADGSDMDELNSSEPSNIVIRVEANMLQTQAKRQGIGYISKKRNRRHIKNTYQEDQDE